MGRGTVATLKRDEIKGASDVRKMLSADKYSKTSSRETGTSNCFYFPDAFSGTLPFKIEGEEGDNMIYSKHTCWQMFLSEKSEFHLKYFVIDLCWDGNKSFQHFRGKKQPPLIPSIVSVVTQRVLSAGWKYLTIIHLKSRRKMSLSVSEALPFFPARASCKPQRNFEAECRRSMNSIICHTINMADFE